MEALQRENEALLAQLDAFRAAQATSTGTALKEDDAQMEAMRAAEPRGTTHEHWLEWGWGGGGGIAADLPDLNWLNGIAGEAAISEGVLTMRAAEKTDWFNPPPVAGQPSGLANAPAMVFVPPEGDWQLSARVVVEHRYLFDAGVIFVHQGPDDWSAVEQYWSSTGNCSRIRHPSWAKHPTHHAIPLSSTPLPSLHRCKLCFEFSPEKRPTVVSVVTRGLSDDANGPVIKGTSVHLRVSKSGPLIAFHYLDGSRWTLHRIFCLREPLAPMSVGFLAQAPTGPTCAAAFSGIEFSATSLRNPRDGS